MASEVEPAQARQQVVAKANHIVAVDANDAFAICGQPVLMLVKAKIVQHLNVSAIVPEAHTLRIAGGQQQT